MEVIFEQIVMNMRKSLSNTVILGEGPCSKALALLLGCPQFLRNQDDSDWNWPLHGLDEQISFIIVPHANSSASKIIQWHADAWRCNNIRQARSIIFVVGSKSDFIERDVFGRVGDFGEAFSDWINYIAVTSALAEVVANLNPSGSSLRYCPLKTWQRKADEAAVIPALYAAICSRDNRLLSQILIRASLQDWDSVCPRHPDFGEPHQYANQIRKWLNSVTNGVTPEWDVGRALICRLAASNNQNHATAHKIFSR